MEHFPAGGAKRRTSAASTATFTSASDQHSARRSPLPRMRVKLTIELPLLQLHCRIRVRLCRMCSTPRCPVSWPSMERSEEHTSELQSLMRISYAAFYFKTDKKYHCIQHRHH